MARTQWRNEAALPRAARSVRAIWRDVRGSVTMSTPSRSNPASSAPVKPDMSSARPGGGGSNVPLHTLHTCQASRERARAGVRGVGLLTF